ncbi:MAG: GUN4 domain-containing protein [Microcoleus sp. PH2017_40_RAT_O_B]|uniref:serine/threonine-protein kinase n=1 Tax=unclassified Microcoleus TaxID=2642155 RepID=UPI001D529A15|nr:MULTISPECIES: serine/threonine-protein kinase [unclassified Microcoleus]MCC3575397.1 GUN4 domain-containing protein [Microcoleus sp. PH2017_34_RAT_O_A]MCC3583771.1 GUN4 domain-containing protein [Microcoleus sp. PH2017_30_WIL_O_A]MCC3613044.1 GUN4 domain-containing protein [Microcoleus sp. PH2017_40_RAT_O_B]
MVWTPGQGLNGDRYIIEAKLGEGGFGITYLAQKAQNGGRVVIKTLKDELLSHPDFPRYRDKFRDEALLLSLCRHPNIVQIDNYFIDGDLPCIAMEYVAGENLLKWVEKRGLLSESEALNYIRKVGEALIIVHEKGLLHRDIKPQNIMVRDNQDAVLIDFGLARGFIPDRTQQMTFGLTHGFAPPEQYGEMGRFAEYTDVYALAATLYYMLTITPPTAAFMRALNHPLKPPFQINPNISDAVHRAIMKGMEMNETKRPQSVEKWLAMLPQSPGNRGQRGGVSPRISSPQPAPQPVKLISAKGVDYRNLDRLLASGKWQEADGETAIKMLEVAGRTKDGWLRGEDIDRFPCEDLRTIDQLWVKYSNGRFGFSVQKRIYESLGGSREYDRKIWAAFGDRVGWRVNSSKWLHYNDLKFNTKAPIGHLPCVKGKLTDGVVGGGLVVGRSLLSRRDL